MIGESRGSRRPRGADAAILGAFFLNGVVTVLLGPILPELAADWSVGPARLAPLFTAQFIASSIGAVLSGFHLARSLTGGYVLIGAGLVLLAAGGRPLAIPAMAVVGLGLGLSIAASNLYVAHRESARRAGSLATLNLVWGFGAATSPLWVAGARAFLSLPAALACLAAAAATASVALSRSLPSELGSRRLPSAEDARPAFERGADSGLTVLASIAALLFLYVGAETAVGGWLITLSDQLAGERATTSLVIGSGFWAAILVGRAATPWTLRALSEPALYRLCLVLAIAGATLLLFSGSRLWLAVAAVVAGLGMAPLFPLTVSLLAEATTESRSRTAGWVLACGGLGGAALPWLTGRVAGAGTLQRGFVVPLAGLLLLATLYALRRRGSS